MEYFSSLNSIDVRNLKDEVSYKVYSEKYKNRSKKFNVVPLLHHIQDSEV
jgi:hypothetical protein